MTRVMVRSRLVHQVLQERFEKLSRKLELMPGQQVRIGYVDLANARGERNVIYPLKLPVLAGISNVLAAAR